MCLFCFSKENLTQEEMQGKYGESYAPFLENTQTFSVSLCATPCRAPLCWATSAICLCPTAIYMRHKALNHIDPGSGWSNYVCCQGYFPAACCFTPGEMGERKCPCLCMSMEALCCPGAAVSATSHAVRERYSLGMDEDDVRLIRCSNCLFLFSCVLNIVACMTDCEGDDALASVVNTVADVVFCCVSGCMSAQVNHEIKVRERDGSPENYRMQR